MVGELIAVVNALLSAAKIRLEKKDRQLVEQKLREAASVIEKATLRDISKYDRRHQALVRAISQDEDMIFAFVGRPEDKARIELLIRGRLKKSKQPSKSSRKNPSPR